MTSAADPIDVLCAERANPEARAVLEDAYLDRDWRVTRIGVFLAADDAADADASALNQILHGDIDMTPGLKLLQLPGRYYSVTRVGGDEYLLLGAVTVRRTSGTRYLDALAADGPKKDHAVSSPDKMPEEIHRLLIRRCKPASEEAWREACPRPTGWDER